VKNRIILCMAGFAICLQPSLAAAQANSFGGPTANNRGAVQTYTYSVTDSREPHYSGVPQSPVPASPSGSTLRGQPPLRQQQPAAPRTAYQQPFPQAQPALQRPAPASTAKKKRVANTSNQRNVAAAQPQRTLPQDRGTAAYPYQQNYPPQARTVPRQAYNPNPQASSYTNPYQAHYATAPNYYQGYSYNWGSSGQACPPGRA